MFVWLQDASVGIELDAVRAKIAHTSPGKPAYSPEPGVMGRVSELGGTLRKALRASRLVKMTHDAAAELSNSYPAKLIFDTAVSTAADN